MAWGLCLCCDMEGFVVTINLWACGGRGWLSDLSSFLGSIVGLCKYIIYF